MRLSKLIIVILLFVMPAHADNSAVDHVGILVCLSGDCAQWGQSSLNGALLAMEEVNTHGGINGQKLVLRIEDSHETKLSDTITGFQKLAADSSIRLILGPSWAPAGMALAPLAKHKKILLVTPSIAVSDFSKTADNLFNVMPPEDLMTEALVEFALGHNWKRAGIFASQHPAESAQGKIFESKFKERGGTVAFFANPLPDAVDLSTEALKISKSKPDAVFISNWWGIAPKALRKIGFTGPILTRQMDQQRLEAAGGSLEQAYFPRYPKPSTEFEAKYRAKFGEVPPLYAATAYDIIMLYSIVSRKLASEDATSFRDAFAEVIFQGASGLIEFGPDRTVLNRSVEIGQIRENKLHDLLSN